MNVDDENNEPGPTGATNALPGPGPDLPEIPLEIAPARRLLEEYSGIAPEDVDTAICQIRAKALADFPTSGYFASFSFLNLKPALEDPVFQSIAARLKAPGSTETFLDVGCNLGLAIRHLIAEGVPSERLFGTDLQPSFLDLGHELFRDRETSKAKFVAGDMLNEADGRLDRLDGKVDIIYALNFFHLFERNGQSKVAQRMVRFLRPDNPNAMIFGRNQGPKIQGWERYILDESSWSLMWHEVGMVTGTRWRTEMDVRSTVEWNDVRFTIYRRG